MVFSWHTDTITRIRAPMATDSYNNPVRDWGNAVETPLTGWRVQPVQGSRRNVADTIPRDGLEKRRRAFGPPGVDLLPTDRVRWKGVVWVIDGDVDAWGSPTGQLAHTEVMLVRMEG